MTTNGGIMSTENGIYEKEGTGHGVDFNKTVKKVEPPKKYKVVLHNDDFTPMDFVVLKIMDACFNFSFDKAAAIMMQVHEQD